MGLCRCCKGRINLLGGCMGDLIEKRFLLPRLQALADLFGVAGEDTELRVHAVDLLEDDGQ